MEPQYRTAEEGGHILLGEDEILRTCELVLKYLKDYQVDEETMFLRCQWAELKLVGKVTEKHDMRKSCVGELSKETASPTRLGLVDEPGPVSTGQVTSPWAATEGIHLSDREWGQETSHLSQ